MISGHTWFHLLSTERIKINASRKWGFYFGCVGSTTRVLRQQKIVVAGSAQRGHA